MTKREKELLELMAKGLSTREISAILHISLSTVETHRKNIIKKLDAKNTVEAVARALRAKLID